MASMNLTLHVSKTPAAHIVNGIENADSEYQKRDTKVPNCRMQIVETLPKSVFSKDDDLPPHHLEMYQAWLQLIQSAQHKIGLPLTYVIYSVTTRWRLF